MNSPPLAGSLECSPVNGEAYATQFELFATSWVDDDMPLSYVFSINETIISDRILSQYIELVLPEGNRISVQVYDSYDGYTTSSKDIIVIKSEESFEHAANYTYNNLP